MTSGNTPCGTTVIEPNPTFPLLADGQLVHTQALSGVQHITVTIPTNVTCEHCVLQVVEFMSAHALNNPGGCFCHHCATINVRPPDAGVTSDAGTPDGGTGAELPPTGCGSQHLEPSALLSIALTVCFALRRGLSFTRFDGLAHTEITHILALQKSETRQ